MKKERFTTIDDIRGFTMILMIMIHTNAYYLAVPIAKQLREFSQFAVVAFIFCSVFISSAAYLHTKSTPFIDTLKKRIWRLLKPYFIFLLFYFPLIFFAHPKTMNPTYIVQNLTLTGGIDFNWLVLLFIELIFVTQCLLDWFHNKRKLFWVSMIAGGLSSIYFLFHTPVPYFRYVMWLPWSLVVGFSILVYHFRKLASFWMLTGIAVMVSFLFSRQLLINIGRSIIHFDNKYPPNMYHLSYGMLGVLILYIISAKTKIFSLPILKDIISFMSTYSYSLYFIHILVLFIQTDILKTKLNGWLPFFLVTLCVSVLIQLVLTHSTERLPAGRQG